MNFKVGNKVFDIWWSYKIGKVVRVTKSSVHIMFPENDKLIYDNSHFKFLKLVTKGKK